MARVSVVIPTWNGLTHLQQCLPALMAQEAVDFEVVVVDNGSSDGTTDYLGRCYPTIHVIRNDRNLGFAAANNAAMRATRTEFVATLNNDTLPRPRWLSSLVKAADAHADYGAFASKMCFWQQPHVINSAGLVVDRAGLAWDRHCGDPVEEASAKAEVFGASAGAALYRRELLDDIGLFDERFFAYLEDVDLAWRALVGGMARAVRPGGRSASRVFRHVSSRIGLQAALSGPKQGLASHEELPLACVTAVPSGDYVL